MRLAVDACCWSNRRGFGRYTRELLARLVPLAAGRHEVVLVADRATAEAATFPSGARLAVADTREQPTRAASASGARSPADLWRMRRAALAARPDVFLFPAVYTYYPLPRQLPTVVTFHDAIAESLPELVFPRWRPRLAWRLKTRLALARARRVLTVSAAAREQLAAAFGLDPARVGITGEGPGAIFRPPADPAAGERARQRWGLPAAGPLLLYVGGVSPHKNLDGLALALARLEHGDGAREIAWHLAIVGDHSGDAFLGCYEELRRLIAELGLVSKVTFTGYVPDEDLAALYGTATLLVLPSFSEGFGLPAVEAMACGLPVAASRTGSLPEVVGDAGLFFDPADEGEMATVLARLLGDAELRAELGQRGLRRAREHSWEAAAGRVLSVLEEVALGGAAARGVEDGDQAV